jgi:ParB-like chromosome segregation protein Spo0J
MKLRDRIKELRRVKASDLLPNPKNWRTHSPQQLDALRGALAEVGWADAALARETPQGLMLLDGHARAEIAPDAEIPVLVLDVNETEADLILATLDPLAAMAGTDASKLDELLQELKPQSEALQEMLADMRTKEGLDAGDDLDTGYQPEDSASKGLREFGARLTPDQFEQVKQALAELVEAGHGDTDPDNPDRLGNALHYGLCARD